MKRNPQSVSYLTTFAVGGSSWISGERRWKGEVLTVVEIAETTFLSEDEKTSGEGVESYSERA